MMPLRQRLALIANQAAAEKTHFVESAIREAMDSLAAYDVRVTDLLRANSGLVEERREAARQEGATRVLLWSIINTFQGGKVTIPKRELQAFSAGLAQLDIKTDKATGDVTITAVLLPANEAANG